MNPKSHTLFHFTKSKEILKLIFRSGFWPRYCLEDIRWIGQDGADFIAFPMVCFCDVPLARISEHVDFYGSFGLGMTKNWANSNSLNPILYLSGDNNLNNQLRALNNHANKLKGEEQKAAKVSMRYIYSHIKPTDGTIFVDGKPVKKEFYQESEWRYVPLHHEVPSHLMKEKYEDPDHLKLMNDKTKEHCSIRISPNDVKYVFVKSDTDIPDMVNFIQTELDSFPGADLKVLMSRVVSLESIQEDL